VGITTEKEFEIEIFLVVISLRQKILRAAKGGKGKKGKDDGQKA